MGVDEEGTIARQKAHREELIDPEIAAHGGRIVKTMGDGLLVEFSSVVDAVKCAVAVQEGMTKREADVAEEHCIQFRVGVNLGDIVIDGEDILGDGVNIAARLEGLAKPGGICVSEKVFTEVGNKLDTDFEDLGPQAVKNIAEPLSPPGRSCSLISASSSFPSVTTMSQKSSVMQLPQFVPKALTSDIQ